MDKLGYQQLDRIEQSVGGIQKLVFFLATKDGREAVLSFYEQEVLDEEGKLHHLEDDSKLSEFMKNLEDELMRSLEKEDKEDEEEEKEEFSQ